MVAPGTSEPLNYIVEQISRNADRAAGRCSEIYSQQRATSTKAEVDQLRTALGRGRAFVYGEYSMINGLTGTDPDGADGALRQDLAGYSHRLEEMIERLERYTYPYSVHHDAMHDKNHSHTHRRTVVFPFYVTPVIHHHHHHRHRSRSYSPYQNHHRDTLFANQLKEWNDIRDGITQAFASFRDRLQIKSATKKKEDEAVEKAKNAEKKETDREKQRADELAKDLEEFKDNEKQLRRKRQMREQILEDNVHDLANNTLTGNMVGNSFGRRTRSLERDPIDDLNRIAHIFSRLDMDRNPRRSLDGLHVSARATAGAASTSMPPWHHVPELPDVSVYCPECWLNNHIAVQHPYGHPHHHHHRRVRNRSVSTSSEERRPPVVIQNVMHGPEVDFEVEEATSVSGSRPGRSRSRHHHRDSRSNSVDTSSDDSLDIQGRNGRIIHLGSHAHGHRHHEHAGYHRALPAPHHHTSWPHARSQHRMSLDGESGIFVPTGAARR